ncbi:MAG: DNA adenine methylase, partial [Proteobacteria bacterium]|nr:DNA adenine methylase [Pseudomonadota bacterium]
SRDDFQRMADKLQGVQGKFLLSINDRPEIREMFAWADIEAVTTTYSIQGGDKASTAAELLIGRGVELAPAAAQRDLF